MQLPTEPRTTAIPRGDEGELYRRHHRDLERAVARAVRATPELIEDACQNAWAILLRTQPKRASILAWLRVVAVHEAYRLSALERRATDLEAIAKVRQLGGAHGRPRCDRQRDRSPGSTSRAG